MSFTQFDTAAAIAQIKLIDESLPGSMKKAGMIGALEETLANRPVADIDVRGKIPIVRYIDELLPGSMKDAALVLLLGQAAVGPHILDAGIATFQSADTVSVFSTSAHTTNPILLTYQNALSGSSIRVSGVTDGVGFVIASSNGSDTGKVSWLILQG